MDFVKPASVLFLLFSFLLYLGSSELIQTNLANAPVNSRFQSVDLPEAQQLQGGSLPLLHLPSLSSASQSSPSSSSGQSAHLGLSFSSKHKFFTTEKGRSLDIRLAYATDEDELVTVTVLDSKVSGPFHGSLRFIDPNAAVVTYTPVATFTGKDTFLCDICRTREGNKVCLQTKYTVAVRIDTVDDEVTTVEGRKVEFSLLTNDDPLADMATLTIITPPRHGHIDPTSGVYQRTSDVVIYTPSEGFVGFDSLEYEVCQDESRDNCGRAVATIHVKLQTVPDDFEVSSRVSSKFNVLTNDFSLALVDPRTLEVTTEPSHGIIVSIDSKTGDVTYLPNRNFAGEDVFYYTVCSKEMEDEANLLKSQQLAESAVLNVNVIFERYQQELKAADHAHESYSHPKRTAQILPMAKEDDPTSMEQVGSWFAGALSEGAVDSLHSEHSTLQDQLVHLKSVEVFSTWLANHEFFYMKKATANTKAQSNNTLGEWDIVIVEVSDRAKTVYAELEAEIEATVSQIFVQDLSYLDTGDIDSAVLAQWLWTNHRAGVEAVVQKASSVAVGKLRICSDPVPVSLTVPLWAKDDVIQIKEGSTIDVVVLANDHPLADPSTLRVVSPPSAHGAKVAVVQKGDYAVIRYSTPAGFFGQDSFEYEVCTDLSLSVCGKARVLATVESHAVVARNDHFQLPYNPTDHKICPLANDVHVDLDSIKINSESAKGASLELEMDAEGKKTGCVLYTSRSETDTGDDHFHYEVCGQGRGSCEQAKVRVDVACSYFDRNPSEVDYLLLRKVVPQLVRAVDATVAELLKVKALGEKYDAWGEKLAADIVQWNRELKSFCKDELGDMELLQAHVLSKLNQVQVTDDCTTPA